MLLQHLQVGLSDASDLVNTSFARSYTHHQVFLSLSCMMVSVMIMMIMDDNDDTLKSQKSVVCDEPSSSGERSTLVAYLGGIDLTDGRWLLVILRIISGNC